MLVREKDPTVASYEADLVHVSRACKSRRMPPHNVVGDDIV
jgi:hypothetical protein